MSEQFTFGDAPQIINPSEPHMALIFLVDISGSMSGEPINELNNGMNRFKQQVIQDEKTKAILDVAVITFSDSMNIVQDWTPIEYMNEVNFVADGGTNMGEALSKSIEMINERSRFYRRQGTEPYKPWIVLISDGQPFDDVNGLAVQINDMVEQNKLAFWSLAVPGADMNVLHQLSGKRVLNLQNNDFVGFFDWVNKSMRAVSTSTPGEKVKGQALPPSIRIDDIMNNSNGITNIIINNANM